MFTSGELERASMAVDEPMKELESRIMTDIVRRIRENSEIKSAIEEALGNAENITDDLFEKVIGAGYVRDKKLYEAVGKVQIPFQENEPLQQLISSVTAQTNETMRNITQSLGFAQRGSDGRLSFTPIADYYQKTLDKAMLDISSGAFDYNTVLKRTVKDMTNSGLRTIDYATGWSNRVDVAARRAVMTGMTQLTAKVNEDNAEALETDWFEISWHSGARPSHWWGGKWYTKEQLMTICKLGDVQGLCGANCYHNYSPVIPGISEPTYTAEELEELNHQENEPVEWKGKQYTKYEALQRQRRLETTMRAQRQEMALLKEGGADEDDLINCRARYRVTSAEYTRFSEAMGLPQQRERVSADGLGNIMQGKYTGGSGKESPVRVPPVGAKVTNKVTAEERKELLSRDKVDIADNAKTTKPVKKASAVELWETENYKNSTEKGLLILPDGTTKDFGGIEHHVTGKEEDIKLMDGATFTHNHPTDNTFSQNDIVTGLVKGNLKEMRAVTSTGDVHILVNNGATEQQRKKFNVDYQQRRMKAANVADAKIRRGERINKDEYVKSRLETFMAEHAEEYNLSYSKTRIDVNNPSIDKSAKGGIIKSENLKMSAPLQKPPDFSKYEVKSDLKAVEAFKETVSAKLGIPISDISLDGIRNTEVLEPFINRIEQIQKETGMKMPALRSLSVIDGDETCIAGYKRYENTLYISSKYFNSKDALVDTLKEWANNGTLPKQGKTIRYLAEHETAHIRIPVSDIESEEGFEIFRKAMKRGLCENDKNIYEFYADCEALDRMGYSDKNIQDAVEYLKRRRKK